MPLFTCCHSKSVAIDTVLKCSIESSLQPHTGVPGEPQGAAVEAPPLPGSWEGVKRREFPGCSRTTMALRDVSLCRIYSNKTMFPYSGGSLLPISAKSTRAPGPRRAHRSEVALGHLLSTPLRWAQGLEQARLAFGPHFWITTIESPLLLGGRFTSLPPLTS